MTVESSRNCGYGGIGPQSVVLRDAKTGALKSATFLPANAQNQEDLVTTSDKLEVRWNAASSSFIFSAWHTDHFDVLGVILHPQVDSLGLGCSNLSQGMSGKVLSCDFVDLNTVEIGVLSGGKSFNYYWTMDDNGQFEGGSRPPGGSL